MKQKTRRQKLRYEEMVATGPGTLAGKFMCRFWQPICRVARFTLNRDKNGIPHGTELRCPPRGTQLSAGWVEGDSIRCMYHGWLFNAAGQCIEQPAEAKSFAAKIRIKSLPTCEYLGLIFTYFGAGEAA